MVLPPCADMQLTEVCSEFSVRCYVQDANCDLPALQQLYSAAASEKKGVNSDSVQQGLSEAIVCSSGG